MIYHPQDCSLPARVYVVATKEEIRCVLSIDTDQNVVRCDAGRLVGDELEVSERRFDRIVPIRGGGLKPGLFHCYGER